LLIVEILADVHSNTLFMPTRVVGSAMG